MKLFYTCSFHLPLKTVLFSFFLFAAATNGLIAQASLTQKPHATFTSTDIFGAAAFLENKEIIPDFGTEKIQYYANRDDINAYFTEKRLIYLVSKVNEEAVLERKKEKKKEGQHITKEQEKEALNIPIQTHIVSVEWMGANPHPQIITGKKVDRYYTYLKKTEGAAGYKTLITYGYQTITYKDLYPGIDLIYSFPDSGGMEYSLTVRPGADISLVKLNYSGGIKSLKKNETGDLVIHTSTGDIVEHAPVSYTDPQTLVSSEFSITGKTVQFNFPNGYNNSQTLTIDPWVKVLTKLPPTNIGFDVDFDNNANLLVYGAGPSYLYDDTHYFEVAKYDQSGNPLWTFNGSVPAISWNSVNYGGGFGSDLNLPSNFLVDKSTGKIYVGKAFDQYGTSTIRINANGVYDNFVSSIDPSFLETWDFAYNCATGTILALGGGVLSNLNMGVINPTSGTTTTSNFTGIPGLIAQDVISSTYDKNGNLYTILNSASSSLPYWNSLYRVNNSYSGNLWSASSNYFVFNEASNDPFWDATDGYSSNSFNALAANGSYLYYYDGYDVAAYDFGSGAMLGSTTILGYTALYQDGIAVDNCNHVYVGGKGTIKTFTFNGSSFSPGASISLGGGFGNDRIHDVRYNLANNLLYITGDHVVGTFIATLSTTCPESFSLNTTHTCDAATAHVSPLGGLSPAVFTYIWTDSQNNVVSQTNYTTDTINTVSNLSNGTYIVQVQWNPNCGGYTVSDTVTLTCTFTHSPDTTICVGQPVTLWANVTGSTGTFNWQPGGATTPTITVYPDTTTAYVITYTPSAGQGNPISDTIIVTVIQKPEVTVNDTSICVGGTAVLTAVPSFAGGTYNWQPGGATSSSITVTPAGNTSYIVTYTSTCGIAKDTGTVLIIPNPTLATIGDTICAVGSGQITAIPTVGGGTYSWQPGGFTTDTATVSPNTTTTYTVIYTIPGCVTLTDSATVVVTPPPTVSVTTDSVCVGTAAHIQAIPTGGTGTYDWEPGGFTTDTVSVFPDSSTMYTVSFSVHGCPVATDSGIVTIWQYPTLTTSGAAFCAGASGEISATPSLTGGTFIWQPGGATTDSTKVSPLFTKTYVVTYQLHGCAVTDSAIATVYQHPIVAISSTSATCALANGTMAATATGTESPYTFLWNNSLTTDTISNLFGDTTYSVVVTDSLGCATTDSAFLAQYSSVTLQLSYLGIKCSGDQNGSATVVATGGLPPYQYLWSNLQTTSTISSIPSGTYIAAVTDSTGCPAVDSIFIPEPVLDSFVTATTPTACHGPEYVNGTIVVLAMNYVNVPFQYSLSGGSAQFDSLFTNLAAGTYNLTVVNDSGCVTSIDSVVVEEPAQGVVSILPSDTTIVLGQMVQLTTFFGPPSVAHNLFYSWSPSAGLSCTDCANPMVNTFAPENTYTVLVTYDSICTATATANVYIEEEHKLFIPNAFTPNGDGNNDVFLIYGEGIRTVNLKVFNRWGEKVFESGTQFLGWDGTFQGVMQKPAVFVYEADIYFLDNYIMHKKGDVTLIR